MILRASPSCRKVESQKMIPNKIRFWLTLIIAFGSFSVLAVPAWNATLFPWDETILITIYNARTPWLDNSMAVITLTGYELLLGSALLIWWYQQLLALRSLILAIVSSVLVSNSLKLFFARPRPTIVPALFHEVSYSFPSGHTLAAVMFFGTLAIWCFRQNKRGQGALLVSWAALVGFSRIYLGVHYPSDVLASFALGWGMLILIHKL